MLHALCRSGIETYIDDGIPKGDDISQALIQAIENSSISVVIFSENYASSKWCLNELTEILRCKQHQKQHVVPIFCQVDPAHVRKQMGAYEEAFAQHLKNYPEKIDGWIYVSIHIKQILDLVKKDWNERNGFLLFFIQWFENFTILSLSH
ncbi:hypothetical protein K1719_038170 [Acacia pycnantha]|nr:hypothetical protein K1719_038170 [Acacia pycnantha]